MMELSEAVVVSSISTMIIVALYVIRTRYRRRVKFYGPLAYKLDEGGALREISADSVPIGILEAVRERIRREANLSESITLRKPAVILFALIIFIVQLIILSVL